MKQKLDDIEKKEIFQVPDGYFESLPLEIRKRTDKKHTYFTFPAWNWKYALAALCVILASLWLFIPREETQTELPQLSEYSNDEIIDLLLESGVSSYEILSVAANEELLTNPIPEEEILLLEEEMLEDFGIFDDIENLENI